MKVKSIGHTGICVKNLEKSIAFYNGVMGFRVIEEPCEMITDSEEGNAMGFERDCQHRICMLEVIPGQNIELMEFGFPKTAVETPLPMNAIGKHHLSYVVDDISEWVEKFKSEGLDILYRPLPYETDKGTAYWVIVKDPDGIQIELMQE